MGLRAWLARPIILHLAAIERRRIMTEQEVLTQLTNISTNVATIGDAVVALKAEVAAVVPAGTSPAIDAALGALHTSVTNIVSILPAPATPAA
jgi:hypothetical protein